MFLGDDGQGDVVAARAILEATHEGWPAAAWCAIRSVKCGAEFLLSDALRRALVEEMRAAFPGAKPRFFTFTSYAELSAQLLEAGWLSTAEHTAVVDSSARDASPDISDAVMNLDLPKLLEALRRRRLPARDLWEARQIHLGWDMLPTMAQGTLILKHHGPQLSMMVHSLCLEESSGAANSWVYLTVVSDTRGVLARSTDIHMKDGVAVAPFSATVEWHAERLFVVLTETKFLGDTEVGRLALIMGNDVEEFNLECSDILVTEEVLLCTALREPAATLVFSADPHAEQETAFEEKIRDLPCG